MENAKHVISLWSQHFYTLNGNLTSLHNIDFGGGRIFLQKFNFSQYILLMIVWEAEVSTTKCEYFLRTLA